MSISNSRKFLSSDIDGIQLLGEAVFMEEIKMVRIFHIYDSRHKFNVGDILYLHRQCGDSDISTKSIEIIGDFSQSISGCGYYHAVELK